ncbi:hypothetical protein C8J57DRAFT_1653124 [Mycena rebaudengoi]|nr:hypothetical protein C8J57DRAFT_1653124 [Mycena rebaudengoi]
MQLSTSNLSLAWICALKTISVSVPGSNHPHKYFCGCLNPQTEKDIDFGAWIQPPAQIFLWPPPQIFMWVLGSAHRKDIDFGAWIQPPAQIFIWVLGSSGLDPGTQISIASGAWNQLPSKCMNPDTRKNITAVVGVWIQTPAEIFPLSLAAILLQCMDPGTHKKIPMGILERLRAWLIAGFSDQSSSMIHEEFNGYSHSDADDDSCYEGLR